MSHEHLKDRASSLAKTLGLTQSSEWSCFEHRLESIVKVECTLVKAENLAALASMVRDGLMVDFCYIDPPYNTGGTFVYDDNRTVNRGGLWGKHHDWMSFMLPRLVGAHAVLSRDGVMAISIDDYEYSHLKILMDHVFGADNHIATLVVCRSKNGKGGKSNVAVNHEYVLLYGKSSKSLLRGVAENDIDRYDKEDEYGKYVVDGLFRKKGDASRREDRPNMHYSLYYSLSGKVSVEQSEEHPYEARPIDSQGIERRWLWGKEKAKEDAWKLFASKNGVIYVKNYSTTDKRIKIRSLLDRPEYLTDKATTEIKALYGEKVFETPKPLELIKDLVDCCSSHDAVVLDFFGGTGTTAQAVYELNRISNGRRIAIVVEQPLEIEKNHIARQHGFVTTADITEYRLAAIRKSDSGFQYLVLD